MAIAQTNERTFEARTEELPQTQRQREEERREEQTSARVAAGGFSIDVWGGATAVVLTILGLAGLFPPFMLAIAVIVVGAALLLQGGTIAARLDKLIRETSRGRIGRVELGGGLSAEMIGGAAGIALGILALLGVVPIALTSVAVIVFGGTLLLSSGSVSRVAQLRVTGHPEDRSTEAAREVAMSAAGGQALVGLAAATLGILALVGMVPLTLSLVAMLAVGGSVLFSGAAVSGRMLTLIFG